MKDAFGKLLCKGDKIVYIKKVAGTGSSIKLAKGTIVEFKGRYAKVSSHNYMVSSQSIFKLG